MVDEPLVLGVDLSTQSCTVEVRDADSFEVVARHSVPLPPTSPPVSEHDVLVWWSALRRAVAKIDEAGVDLGRIAAVSVAGQCHGLVPLDADGQPVRPVKLWNDTTSAPQVERMVAKVGKEEWIRRVGSLPTAAFTVGKLAWLLEREPENARRIAHIVLPHDYINYRLTGQFVTDRSEASGTGYFNSQTNQYDWDLLEELFGDALEWASVLPRVLAPSEAAGELQAGAALELGLTPGIPVAVGGGDQHVGALGLGISEGDIAFSLGTSGVVIASSSTPVHDLSGRVDGVANAAGGWLPLVCTLNCTKVTDWAASLLGIDVYELDRLAMTVIEGASETPPHVPVFAAYLDGERSPALPLATGVMAGLTHATGRAEFAAAIFDGVLMGLLSGMDALKEAGAKTGGRIIAVGGGSKSPVYTQGIANLAGREVQVLAESDVTVRGACLQALALLQGQDVASVAQAHRPPTARIVQPMPNSARWTELRDRYRQVAFFAGTTTRN